jgi:hypothetical protein
MRKDKVTFKKRISTRNVCRLRYRVGFVDIARYVMSHMCKLHCRFCGEQNVKRAHKNGNCKWLVEEVRELRRTISNSVAKVAQKFKYF